MKKVQPIRELNQIQQIEKHLKTTKTAAFHAMFVLGVNTNLRVGDLLGLTWGDVWEDTERTLRNHITICDEKTDKTLSIKITENMAEALNYVLENHPLVERRDPIIRNPVTRKVYSREHVSRRLGIEARKVGIEGAISAHSLRKTWGYHAVITYHQPITLVQAAFNHSSLEQSMDYLCITGDQIADTMEAESVANPFGVLAERIEAQEQSFATQQGNVSYLRREAHELERIVAQLSHLDTSEKGRLDKRVRVLRDRLPALRSLRAAVAELEAGQQESMATFLLLVTAVRQITSSVIKVLETTCGVMEPIPSRCQSDNQGLMTSRPASTGEALAAICEAHREQLLYESPLEPRVQDDVHVLDGEAIKKKRAESESVVALLDGVLVDDDLVGAIQEDNPIGEALDEAHLLLIRELLANSEISTERWSELCRESGLLPAAAIEAINEAVLDEHGGVLIVCFDPIAADAHIATLLRK